MLGFLQSIIDGIQWFVTLVTNLFRTVTVLFDFVQPVIYNGYRMSISLQNMIPLPVQLCMSIIITIMVVRLICTLGFRS